ncbi:hypothetical protein [Dehalobacterium formicoaceticum]|uniref:hypothetical protein n=1 Tax=Dehalobacterium formicoaceticum TaxID=51515 RepID=UPI000B7ECE7D|nr:hypothetical protein [Dehalobacterium formicoaceticum]
MNIIPAEQSGILIQDSGSSALDMARRLEETKAKLILTKSFFESVMEKDVDYGTIPGTQKPSLLQPGADKLSNLYGFSKMIEEKQEKKDYDTGHYDVTVKVRLIHRGSQIIAGEGEGSCSTYESKYRYRWVPEWELLSSIDKDSLDYKEKIGKNGQFKVYRVENEDLFSQWNTVLKMATKRAFVAAILSATGLSGLFSQDDDDFNSWIAGTGNDERDKGKRNKGNHGNHPTASASHGKKDQPNRLEQQKKAIIEIGKNRGLNENMVEDLFHIKHDKALNDLTSEEAGQFIVFLQKTDPAELVLAFAKSEQKDEQAE